MNLSQGCGFLAERHTSFCSRVTGMRGKFTSLLTALQTEITALVASPSDHVDGAVDGLNAVSAAADDALPSDLKHLMQQECFLPFIPPSVLGKMALYDQISDLPSVFGVRLLRSIQTALRNRARNALGTVTAGVAAGHVSAYNEAIQRSGFADILDGLDHTYLCLTSLCDHTGVANCANDARVLLNLKSNNRFNTSAFSTWNSDAVVVSQLNQLKDALDIKESIISNLSF